MAKQREDTATVIDWYLISIDRLKKAGMVLLILLLGAGAWFFRDLARPSPRQKAESAIEDAEKALNDLAATADFAAFRAEFDQGQAKLNEAKERFSGKSYEAAESSAIESQTIVRAALARVPGEAEADAQFLTVEGDVQYQKSGGSWNRADVRTKLSNGDWVKTAGGASAEVIFANGSLYTIGPNALLEIYSTVNPKTRKKQNAVQMEIGTVEINTADDSSAVQTKGTEVIVSSSSTAQVEVGGEGQPMEIAALRGSSVIRSRTGDEEVTLGSGERAQASPEGTISEVEPFVGPPALVTPTDNQVISANSGSVLELTWNPQPQARTYRLQVSRSRLFATLEIDDRRTDPRARVKLTADGAFYWRVASIGADGEMGPFSPVRRFRVAGITATPSRTVERDKTPPALRLKRPFNIGGQFYIVEGQAEPGATVLVNDQEIGVQADGSFRKLVTLEKVGWNAIVVKAVDPAGNTAVQTERVLVEE